MNSLHWGRNKRNRSSYMNRGSGENRGSWKDRGRSSNTEGSSGKDRNWSRYRHRSMD